MLRWMGHKYWLSRETSVECFSILMVIIFVVIELLDVLVGDWDEASIAGLSADRIVQIQQEGCSSVFEDRGLNDVRVNR